VVSNAFWQSLITKQLSESFGSKLPNAHSRQAKAVESIQNSCYMDDVEDTREKENVLQVDLNKESGPLIEK
jgi:hypothetical protein